MIEAGRGVESSRTRRAVGSETQASAPADPLFLRREYD